MKKIILLLFLVAIPVWARAQRPENRWVLGGSFGFGLSDSQTSINISPQIGYRLTDFLTAGGGINYAYYKYRNRDIQSNYMGLNAYLRAMPIRYIHLFAQPEIYRRWGKTGGIKDDDSVFGTLLLGGGVVIPVVQGGIVVSVYYDVIQDSHSPYRDGLRYSVGYTFYF